MGIKNSEYLDPYENLANAIIQTAATDYRAAMRRLCKNHANYAAASEAAELERFFRSAWYEMLTDLDGEYLLGRLRQEFPEVDRTEADRLEAKRREEARRRIMERRGLSRLSPKREVIRIG